MLSHIVSDAEAARGRPRIRESRISVGFILEPIAGVACRAGTLTSCSYLTAEDLEQVSRHAARSVNDGTTPDVTSRRKPVPLMKMLAFAAYLAALMLVPLNACASVGYDHSDTDSLQGLKAISVQVSYTVDDPIPSTPGPVPRPDASTRKTLQECAAQVQEDVERNIGVAGILHRGRRLGAAGFAAAGFSPAGFTPPSHPASALERDDAGPADANLDVLVTYQSPGQDGYYHCRIRHTLSQELTISRTGQHMIMMTYQRITTVGVKDIRRLRPIVASQTANFIGDYFRANPKAPGAARSPFVTPPVTAGQVVTAAGSPVVGTQVFLIDYNRFGMTAPLAILNTDNEGRFSTTGGRSGGRYVIALAPDGSICLGSSLEVPSLVPTMLFTLAPPTELRVPFQDAAGHVLTGLSVSVLPTSDLTALDGTAFRDAPIAVPDALKSRLTGRTDGHGVLTLKGLPQGSRVSLVIQGVRVRPSAFTYTGFGSPPQISPSAAPPPYAVQGSILLSDGPVTELPPVRLALDVPTPSTALGASQHP